MAKVLVVAPDEKTRKLYQAAITFQGIETMTAGSASEVLDNLDEGLSLILIDVSTPDLREINLIKEVEKVTGGKIPLIIIADMKNNQNVSEKSIEGVCEYLSKSDTSVGDVIKKVREVISDK